MEDDFGSKIRWFCSYQTTQMITLTTQSQWLVSLREIVNSLQSPQRIEMVEGQEEIGSQFLFGTQSSKVKTQ